MEVLEAVGARDSALSADLLRTLYRWLGEKAAGEPLVHAVEAEKLGEPSVPFAAVVEAYVLHALRQLGLSSPKIREAAEAVRREFDEP